MTETNNDKSINHVEAMKLLPLYLAGELDNKISNRIRQHLENCQECRMEADALKDTLPELQIEAVQENLTEPKVERILRRSRLRALFSGGIISFMIGAGILLSLFLLMFVTKPLLYGKGNEIRNVVNLGVPLTQPGVFVSGSGGKVGYWGSLNAEGKLKRCIGGSRSWDAGKITGTVNLWGAKLFNYEWIADRQTIYRFKLPQSNNNRVSEKNIRLLWEGLERLP
ncbi:MAG: zf-HC2 domain-containing protein, partial [Desulfotomaculaceae bacterium]|nr:zf-HC2 domain-containing protein [Desulfotomaculaceae bacterium]